MNVNAIAIITARGGSKRIPRKNIRSFLGKPIIKYSIDAALASGIFDEVMVSTDDKEIARVSLKYGARVPFFRSKENSGDYASSEDVIVEVLREYKKIGKEFKYFCCIYPTAPFITPEKLKKAMKLLRKRNVDSVFPIVRFSYPIQRSFKVERGYVRMNWPKYRDAMSQDLIPTYHDSGQFYFLRTKKFLLKKEFFTSRSMPLITSELEVQDIDNEEDWRIAEMKFRIFSKVKK